MLQIISMESHSLSHSIFSLYLKDLSSPLILFIIIYFFYVLCLHVCQIQLWSALWVLGIKPGPLEEQPLLLTTELSLQLLLPLNELILVLWLRIHTRLSCLLLLLCCGFPLEPGGPGSHRFTTCNPTAFAFALHLAIKTFWVVCFFF